MAAHTSFSESDKVPKQSLKRDVTLRTIQEAAERLTNWGKWGSDDQIGTLNYITPNDIVQAAALVRKGKAFSLGLDFNQQGPQGTGWGNRFNPIHTMLATGTDAVAGRRTRGDTLRRRHGLNAAAMRNAVGRARPHLLWRENVERLRCAPGRFNRRQEKRASTKRGQDDRPGRAAGHPALQRRRLA